MATVNVSAELDVTQVLSEIDSEDLATELSSRGDEAEVVGTMDTAALVEVILGRDDEDEILNAMTPETIISNLVGRGDTHEILSEINGKDIASFVVEESLIDQVVEFATIDEVVEAVDSGDLLTFLLHKMDIIDAWKILVGHEAFQDVPNSWLITELDNRGNNTEDLSIIFNFLVQKMNPIDVWNVLTSHKSFWNALANNEAFRNIPSGWLIAELDRRGVNLGIPDEVLEASKVITNWINK